MFCYVYSCMFTITGCNHRSETAQSEFESFVLHQDRHTWVLHVIICSYLLFRRHDRYAYIDMHVRVYCCVSPGTRQYCVLHHLLYQLVPIHCTDIFVCKRMHTIDLNFNHAHHRDTYRYICSTNVLDVNVRTSMHTIDLNSNHVHHSDTYIPVCCTDIFM